MKVCSVCRQEKLLEEFHRDRTSRDGKGGRCKPCGIAYRKQYHAANRDAVLTRKRARYEQNLEFERQRNREKYERYRETRLEAARRYYVENRTAIHDAWSQRYQGRRDEYLERNRQWRQENREAVAEYGRRYLREHPERNRAAAHKRRVRQQALEIARWILSTARSFASILAPTAVRPLRAQSTTLLPYRKAVAVAGTT